MELVFLASSNTVSSIQSASFATRLPKNICQVLQQLSSLKNQHDINELVAQSLIF